MKPLLTTIMRPSHLSLLFPILLLSSFYAKANAQELIQNTCKISSKHNPNINYGFCTTSLQAAPASRCANLKGLGKISLRLIQYNLTDTKCYVKQLKKDKRLVPFERRCLEDCFELYSGAMLTIKKAIKDFNSKRFMDVDTEISSIMEAVTTCEDGFKEKRGFISPLTKRNGDTFELSAMALSIMHMTQNNYTNLKFSNLS